ncbi:MAG TPA: hypothetical protein VLA00_16975 [Xanthobacteraceae bacterium]|nr:hypothetical protein [Xanthobacteraceae bacterium]
MSAEWAPLFLPVFIVLILAAMAWILVGALRRHFAPPPPSPPLARWRWADLSDIAFDGTRMVWFGPFRHAWRYQMVSARGLRATDGWEPRRLARFSVEMNALGPLVRGGTARLETSGPSIALAVEPYVAWPWTLAPPLAQVSVLASGVPLGRFEVSDTAVLARDSTGQTVGEWRTGARPGHWLRTDAAIYGRDQPAYAPLRLADGTEAALRLPHVRLTGRRYDFSGIAFLKTPPGEPGEATAVWLLAFVALSAYVSAGLLARERSRPARPPPERSG